MVERTVDSKVHWSVDVRAEMKVDMRAAKKADSSVENLVDKWADLMGLLKVGPTAAK